MFDHDTAHARVGAVIANKYRLLRLISLGAMGAVYESIHEWTQRHVAVKLLFDEIASNRESVERFVREARASSKVGHGNIVEVLDLGRDVDDTLYLVQELLSGDTLRAEIEKHTAHPRTSDPRDVMLDADRIEPCRASSSGMLCKRMSLRDIARCLLPIIDALDAAHAANIVHRDVKPENIVLHRNARGALEPKLIDFGIARLDLKGARLTRAGAILGTPNYMAPEQIRGDLSIDARADLWAVGVILYECAAGRRPFVADNVRELFSKILLEAPTPLEQLAPEMPAEFVALVMRALDREPSRRWPSARALLLEFASIDSVRTDPTLAATFSALGLLHNGTRTLVAGSPMSDPPALALAAALPANTPLDKTIGVAPELPSESSPREPTVRIDPEPAKPANKQRSSRVQRAQLASAFALALATVAVGAFTLRRPSTERSAPESAVRRRSTTLVDSGALGRPASHRTQPRSETAPERDVSELDASLGASLVDAAQSSSNGPPRRPNNNGAAAARRQVFID